MHELIVLLKVVDAFNTIAPLKFRYLLTEREREITQ